jgi:hypothetical protein
MMDLNPSDGAASLQNNLPSQNTISESLIQEPEPAQSLNAGRKSESKNENEKNATTYQRSGEKDKDKDKDKDRDKNHSHDRRRHHSDRRERERERERDKERDRDKSKDKDKDRDRTKKERDKERDKEKDKHKERDKERGRDKDKEHDSERKDKSDHHSSKRKRSPSPDFSQRKKTGWDQMPAMGTSTPQVTKPQIVGVPGLVTLSNQARQQRRLYVGNIPATVSEFELMEFFNTVMMSSGVLTNPGPPVIGIQLNREKSYAFLEFRFPEEATAGNLSILINTVNGHLSSTLCDGQSPIHLNAKVTHICTHSLTHTLFSIFLIFVPFPLIISTLSSFSLLHSLPLFVSFPFVLPCTHERNFTASFLAYNTRRDEV